MKQTYRILPTYTSDVSGVCSALYELGGLVVIHDPSGCNSTYNTHDEIRWYDHDSLIFISALTERDAVMGNDEKFYSDVLKAAKEFRPEFIALTNSPIPWLMGTDFPALVKKLEKETGIPAFYVPANGMHDYTAGAGRALSLIAERLVDECCRTPEKNSINILGLTPLDYAAKDSPQKLRAVFEGAGCKVISSWAMDDPLENIRHAGEAAVNLVVSASGLHAAKKLEQRFGTPYVIGTPVGLFTDKIIEALELAQNKKMNINAYAQICNPSDSLQLTVLRSAAFCTEQSYPGRCAPPAQGRHEDSLTLIGDPVVMGSLAAALRLRSGINTQVLCPTETYEGLLLKEDAKVCGEEETEDLLKNAKTIIADPLYKLICPENTEFHPLPHLALSGRIYLKEMKAITDLEV